MNRTSIHRFTPYAATLVALGLGFYSLTGCNQDRPAVDDGAPPTEDMPQAPASAPVSSVSPATVVVEVEGAKLTQGELDMQVENAIRQQQSAGRMAPGSEDDMRAQAQREIVERFVVQRVLLNEAARQNVEVGEGDMAQALTEISSRLPEGIALESALAQTGMTLAQFQDGLKDELKVQKLVEAEAATAPEATAEEVSTFYNEQQSYFETPETVHARHILVECKAEEDDATHAARKALAEGYRQLVVDGTNFETVAAEHSDCPSKDNGGDLGSFPRGKMVGAFEEAAFSQEVDALGPVIKTDFGYHIVQVLARNEAGTKPLEEVQGDIAGFLNRYKRQQHLAAYVQRLRGNAAIRYAEGAAPAAAPMMDEPPREASSVDAPVIDEIPATEPETMEAPAVDVEAETPPPDQPAPDAPAAEGPAAAAPVVE